MNTVYMHHWKKNIRRSINLVYLICGPPREILLFYMLNLPAGAAVASCFRELISGESLVVK
jgi:hypothetical protein